MNAVAEKALKSNRDPFAAGMKPKAKSFVLAVKEFSENLRNEFIGDPMVFTHEESIQSVNILSDLGMGSTALAAGFLHDLYRFPVAMDKIKREFGDELVSLVREYGKISMLAKKGGKRGKQRRIYQDGINSSK